MNGNADLVHLLKAQRFSFACNQNPDRLNDLESNFKGTSQGTIVNRPKNLKITSNCSTQTLGVNLKYNFAADELDNACSATFRGLSAMSEPEIKTLLSYIGKNSSSLSQVILLGK